jgi:hypothetical protein
VSFLTEELVKQGHEVTLFGSGDSQSAATLVPMCQTALRLQGEQVVDPIAYHTRMMELVSSRRRNSRFCIFTRTTSSPPVSPAAEDRRSSHYTEHGRLDTADLKTLFSGFWDMRVVSISNAQRAPLKGSKLGGQHLSRITNRPLRS